MAVLRSHLVQHNFHSLRVENLIGKRYRGAKLPLDKLYQRTDIKELYKLEYFSLGCD
jgi:hypothetical protein